MVTEAELRARARRVRLVVTDVDGTLTDGGVYVSDSGEAMKRFSLRDGMGVERLREVGIETAFLTREVSGPALRRAEKLEIHRCYQGVRDKAAHLRVICEDSGLGPEAIAYLGDDVNDLGIIGLIQPHGLTGAPADAFRAVKHAVHYVCRLEAGHGAFRDFAEWIISGRAEGTTSGEES